MWHTCFCQFWVLLGAFLLHMLSKHVIIFCLTPCKIKLFPRITALALRIRNARLKKLYFIKLRLFKGYKHVFCRFWVLLEAFFLRMLSKHAILFCLTPCKLKLFPHDQSTRKPSHFFRSTHSANTE
jgi:hypothetical protein